MKTGTFMDVISVHYDEIKSLFKSRSYKVGTSFDEDSFNDAFIKCAQKFGNTEVSYDVIIKYFWVTYINTNKSKFAKEHRIETIELDINEHDRCEESDTNIYNIVMDAIAFKFGESSMMMYSLYKFHGWTKDDLIDSGYDVDDYFDDHIKEIHKFVKTYCKKHINSIL